MSKFRRVTKKNFVHVLDNMKKLFEEDDEVGKKAWVYSLDAFLDDLYEQDFFGTEGKIDPRGDHRG